MKSGPNIHCTTQTVRKPVDQSLLNRGASPDGTNGSEKRRQFLEDFNAEHTETYGVINLIAASDSKLIEKAGLGQFRMQNSATPSCVYLG